MRPHPLDPAGREFGSLTPCTLPPPPVVWRGGHMMATFTIDLRQPPSQSDGPGRPTTAGRSGPSRRQCPLGPRLMNKLVEGYVPAHFRSARARRRTAAQQQTVRRTSAASVVPTAASQE